MKQFVLVQPEPPQGFKAQAVSFPEISSVAETEAQAVEQVRERLTTRLNASRLVAVEIAIPNAGNPLVQFAGRAKGDPDFDLYLEEIQRYRQEVDPRLVN